MNCLQNKCKHYNAEKSKRYNDNYCSVSMACILDECPIDRMIRYTEDRLEGLKSIRQYLATL